MLTRLQTLSSKGRSSQKKAPGQGLINPEKPEVALKNYGFSTKSVTITYEEPLEETVSLGEIPKDHKSHARVEYQKYLTERPFPSVRAGHVYCSEDGLEIPKGASTQTIESTAPSTDEHGQLKTRTVTETLKVRGPKAMALKKIASSTLKGMAYSMILPAALTVAAVGLDIVGSVLGAIDPILTATNTLTPVAALMLAGAGVLGGSIGLLSGMVNHGTKLVLPNTLNWTKTDISEPGKLEGYRLAASDYANEVVYQPKFAEPTKVGEWNKPSVRWS